MLEIAICDDNPAIIGVIVDMLRRNASLLPGPFHIRVFSEGEALLAALPFDIIFLDIELGDTTGIRVAEEIRELYENTALIFVSAHESYCKELFQFDATAFLGKPIDERQVRKLLPRINKKLSAPAKVFIYRVKDTVYRIPLEDILFFESKSRQIKLVMKDRQELFYGKLDDMEAVFKERINHRAFVRIHHSFLVNLDNVESFENNTLVMAGGYTLPIAQRKQKEIRRLVMDYYGVVISE